jgi:N,N'-diacetyllegionaminate synthase
MKSDLYFIAEIGVNHCGSLKLAFELINASKESGANAVKFQTFRADCLASKYTKLVDFLQ